MIRPRPKPTLPKILDDLLEQAKAEPGVGRPFNLTGGLCLHLKIHVDNLRHLSLGISRFQAEPSAREWETVCRDAGLPHLDPRQAEKDERHYLYAEFELPVEQEALSL